jgi:hypothetical protein
VIAARQAEIAEGGAAVPRRSLPKERQLAALALFAIPAVRDRASPHSDCRRAKRRLARRDIQVLERLRRHCSVFPESAGSEFNG